MSRSALRSLRAVKAVHTLAWGFFAGCIVAIPVFSSHGTHAAAAWLAVIVLVEVLVLAVNGWVCPLTAIAARYTQERQSNFDIYLPQWLAKYNKHIFGPLYLAVVVFAVANWLHSSS